MNLPFISTKDLYLCNLYKIKDCPMPKEQPNINIKMQRYTIHPYGYRIVKKINDKKYMNIFNGNIYHKFTDNNIKTGAKLVDNMIPINSKIGFISYENAQEIIIQKNNFNNIQNSQEDDIIEYRKKR